MTISAVQSRQLEFSDLFLYIGTKLELEQNVESLTLQVKLGVVIKMVESVLINSFQKPSQTINTNNNPTTDYFFCSEADEFKVFKVSVTEEIFFRVLKVFFIHPQVVLPSNFEFEYFIKFEFELKL